MARTPIPDDLQHKPEEVERNRKLFDDFVRLIDASPDAEITASNLLEKFRQKVSTEGEIKLPFGLIITRTPKH